MIFIPFGNFVSFDGNEMHSEIHWNVAISSIVIGLIGILIAFKLYKNKRDKSLDGKFWYDLVKNKFYIDEVYLFVTKRFVFNAISKPIAWFDRHVVDGAVNGVAWITNKFSDGMKGSQSGQLQDYLLAFIISVVVIFLMLMQSIS